MLGGCLSIQKGAAMSAQILKRAPIGPNLEDYSLLESGIVIGRIFLSPAAPSGPPRPRRLAEGPGNFVRMLINLDAM
jgi:hypothetical protein